MNRLLLSLALMILPFSVLSAEENEEIQVTQFNVVSTVYCGGSKQFHKLFSKKGLKFTGYIDEQNIVKLFLNEKAGYTILVENVGGMSCIHFAGTPGELKEANEFPKKAIKANLE
jgi:hypothetical protein